MRKVISLLLALLLGLFFAAATLHAVPEVTFEVIADVNSPQSIASFDSQTSDRKVHAPFAGEVIDLRFSARLRVRDNVSGDAINAESVTVNSCSFSVYHGPIRVLGPISMAGSQFSTVEMTARPYIPAYNSNGTRTSTNGLSLVGHPVTSTSALYILDHKVTIGTASRPSLTSTVGDMYRMTRSISGTVTIGGETTPFTFTDIAATVQVVPMPESVSQVRNGDVLQLSFKGATAGFDLQGTTNVADPASWSVVPSGSVAISSSGELTTYSIAGVDFDADVIKVYRLRKTSP